MVLRHVHCSHLDDVAIARINLAKFAAISKEGVLPGIRDENLNDTNPVG